MAGHKHREGGIGDQATGGLDTSGVYQVLFEGEAPVLQGNRPRVARRLTAQASG